MAIYHNQKLATEEKQQSIIDAIANTASSNTGFSNVTINNTVVGTSAGIIVPANLNRKALVIGNTDINSVYLDFDVDPTTAIYSLYLFPGATYVLDFLFLGAIHAISTEANTSIAIREFT